MGNEGTVPRFYLPVVTTVHAYQIHAREIGILLVQIVPLADSARLAREFLANELFAGISHLFSGFARDVNLFGDSFDLGLGFDLGLSLGLRIVRIVRGHDYKVQGARCQCRCIISSIFFENG